MKAHELDNPSARKWVVLGQTAFRQQPVKPPVGSQDGV